MRPNGARYSVADIVLIKRQLVALQQQPVFVLKGTALMMRDPDWGIVGGGYRGLSGRWWLMALAPVFGRQLGQRDVQYPPNIRIGEVQYAGDLGGDGDEETRGFGDDAVVTVK